MADMCMTILTHSRGAYNTTYFYKGRVWKMTEANRDIHNSLFCIIHGLTTWLIEVKGYAKVISSFIQYPFTFLRDNFVLTFRKCKLKYWNQRVMHAIFGRLKGKQNPKDLTEIQTRGSLPYSTATSQHRELLIKLKHLMYYFRRIIMVISFIFTQL